LHVLSSFQRTEPIPGKTSSRATHPLTALPSEGEPFKFTTERLTLSTPSLPSGPTKQRPVLPESPRFGLASLCRCRGLGQASVNHEPLAAAWAARPLVGESSEYAPVTGVSRYRAELHRPALDGAHCPHGRAQSTTAGTGLQVKPCPQLNQRFSPHQRSPACWRVSDTSRTRPSDRAAAGVDATAAASRDTPPACAPSPCPPCAAS
jgi:hypothetical protein